ncbi:hypothetical protein PPERSA_06017 [Pseudocohnilembus persalinus]|uniref:Uncharacterized protein n=1 Tax=Pseudocohnilembus persalinus TaxID=266149 RepID=A0A0V0QR15_PSEPJ|nr:hypothetical protein PPERSA_06017 [Pseudocohnilembus persalinus]|eukprot:KRX04464.1 hypothetical protein PPERSA_06017 [Pseudocohnilembus persalinus]
MYTSQVVYSQPPIYTSQVTYPTYSQSYINTQQQYQPKQLATSFHTTSRIERVPVEREVIEYESVPVKKTYVDYDVIEYQNEYIPRVEYDYYTEQVPVKSIEYVPVQRTEYVPQERIDYIPQQRRQERIEYDVREVPVNKGREQSLYASQAKQIGGSVTRSPTLYSSQYY